MIDVDHSDTLRGMETMGERLRAARVAAGHRSATVAAQALGVSASTYRAHENGQNLFGAEEAKQYGRKFSVDPGYLLTGIGGATASTAPTHEEADEPASNEPEGDAVFVSGRLERFQGPRDVEKLGVVAAGDDGDFRFNGEVTEYVARPRGLMGRPGVFALEIISDSMYPAHRKGDPIFCDRMDPQIGDDVVIETFPEENETVGKAFVKRLVRRTKAKIIVEQFNPPSELTFDRYAVKHVWRVVPPREIHGY